MPKIQIYKSISHNPHFNLAFEDYLFNNISQETIILYLWQNNNTIVIGKTQNAWRECKISEFERDGITLARRTSGGGAVFHDLGNVCYTFIASSGLYNQEKYFEIIHNALETFGIKSCFSGRNDIITEDGRKFSGNAFRFQKDVGLMHGTLLFDADMAKLARYLNVSAAKLKAKSVSSVKSRVINLKELNSNIDVDSLYREISSSFISEYPQDYDIKCETISEDILQDKKCPYAGLLEAYNNFSSYEWNYGETIDFTAENEKKYSWGLIRILLNVQSGYIQNVRVETDAMDLELPVVIEASIQGIPFIKSEILSRIQVGLFNLREELNKKENRDTLANLDEVYRDLCDLFDELFN